MNRLILAVAVLFLGSTAGPATAQTPSPKQATPTRAQGLNQGAPGNGMMGICPGMLGLDTKVQVSKLTNGASIVITADDPQVIARVQSASDGAGHCMAGQGGKGGMMDGGMMGKGRGRMGEGAPACCGMGAASETGGPGTGMCPGMMGPGTSVKVAKVAKGISIDVTATEAKAVSRVQKVAQAMQLMHEAAQQ